MQRYHGISLSLLAFVCILFMLVLPIGIILLWSVSNGWFPPNLLPGDYTTRHWQMFLTDPTLTPAIINSMVITVIVTASSMVIAMPRLSMMGLSVSPQASSSL